MPKFFVENSSGLYHRTLHRNVSVVAHHVTVSLLSSAFNKFITLDITGIFLFVYGYQMSNCITITIFT